MVDYLYSLPVIDLFILLNCFFIPVSILAIFLVKRFIPINLRYKDNAVIANTCSLISLIYGVLAGLTALYLINNITYTADAVQREANSVADIYRDSKWLKDPVRSDLQTEVRNYLVRVIQTEWPLMQTGKDVDHVGDYIIDQISTHLSSYTIANNSETLIIRSMLDDLKSLYDSRQQRIQMSYVALSTELWVVILVGTILALCINYLFGMNFYLHIITVVAAALMTSSMIFLLITLDRPFQGEFVIGPNSFQVILDSIAKDTNVVK
jgi:hypothetical protein